MDGSIKPDSLSYEESYYLQQPTGINYTLRGLPIRPVPAHYVLALSDPGLHIHINPI